MADTSAEMMPSTTQRPHAAIVTGMAVVAVAIVAAIAIYHYDTAADAVTVIGPVTAVISSLVAAYFGIRTGTMTQQKANESQALRNEEEALRRRPLPPE